MSERTAFQRFFDSREHAAQFLADIEGLEDDHHHADEDVPLRWNFEFTVDEEDLPVIREELREYIDDGA